MTPEALAAELSSIYRTASGTMSLRPLQGRCLFAAAEGGGLWTNASVGLGKSLMCALLMTVIGGERPVVITEASNVEQLRGDFERYRLHWQIPSFYRLESYEAVSNNPELLDSMHATCLILDEAQKVKSRKESGRGKRFDRWRQTNPRVPVACLSGSPGNRLEHFAHQLLWAVPSLAGTLIPVDSDGRAEGPKFQELCRQLKEDPAFREAWWARLRATPGIVISAETFTEKPLVITHTMLPTPPEMDEHWARLRHDGEAPDGWYLEGPAEVHQLARCLANGMYYEHIPRPPKSYSEPRKDWFRFCQDLIDDEHAAGGPWDTPGQVARGVLAGKLSRGTYDAWMAVKDTYQPLTKTTWLSTAALEYAEQWGAERAPLATKTTAGSIIWTEQTGVGEELARRTKWPYYGEDARNSKGQHVRNATAPVIICAVKSCGTGKNLEGAQKGVCRYSRNLFMSPIGNSEAAEQWIGRTHRSSQTEDVVEVEMLYGCLEDWTMNAKAEADSAAAQEDLTAPRKLLLARHVRSPYPSDGGWAWKKVTTVVVE